MSQALRLFEGFSALDRLTSHVRFAGVMGGEGVSCAAITVT